ncbi:hypothetical protein BGZ97_007744, partial [Linnemannia gamsii]
DICKGRSEVLVCGRTERYRPPRILAPRRRDHPILRGDLCRRLEPCQLYPQAREAMGLLGL